MTAYCSRIAKPPPAAGGGQATDVKSSPPPVQSSSSREAPPRPYLAYEAMKLSLAAAVASSAAFVGCANAFTAPLGGSGAFVTRSSFSVRSTSAGTYHAAAAAAASSATSLTMSIKDITSGAEEKMGKSVDSVKLNLQTVRTGRANASILDRVVVEYYGAPTPLNQLATVSVPSSQQLQIDPYDKSVTAEIEKSIIESGIGLTPNNDGDVIRINIPSLTEDRRKVRLASSKRN